MGERAEAKASVLGHMAALDAAPVGGEAAVLAAAMHPDCLWRGFHPFGEIVGPEAVAARFWTPLRQAFTALRRSDDIVFAGRNLLAGGDGLWVVTKGKLIGLFDREWLGIAPTRRLSMLPYSSFHRVEGGRIAETAMYFDLPHLMRQAGCPAFPAQTAAHLMQAPPMVPGGVILDEPPEAEGLATMAAIERMVADLGQWQLGMPLVDELRRSWVEDMFWWGPEGIGATYTIPRYAEQHSGPFRAKFGERSKTRHVARVAEGEFGGFFGWPNFTARPLGGFLDMPASDVPAEFRVIDLYRRRGDKLAENWIFIDLLHAFMTQGIDVLARATARSGTPG